MSEALLYGDLTYKIIGLGMQVHRALGHGYLEKVYENSLMVLFRKSGIFAEQQVPIKVRFEEKLSETIMRTFWSSRSGSLN